MAWYDEAVFYHIYPLGLLDAPKENAYRKPVHRFTQLTPWIEHVKEIGCNVIYIGPLFESVSHGYDTTDYKKLDSRLGTNEDLKEFVANCHEAGIRVIFDGVFNHTGRDFFAFKDIQQNRENSKYKDWYCNVNFWGNNSYNDGFSYDNWGGYDPLVKLNKRNPEVQGFIADVIRFWVSEFDVDGIRLDTADVLDFDFMAMLRRVANEVKPDFWLMGEVIHGEYNRWVNPEHLHSVTNYALNKALWSGHNEHNYFEIAHTVQRLYGMGGNRPDGLKLYNFADNHDVARIMSKLQNKAHFMPMEILIYTLPGVPSTYYGSEFGIEAEKQRGSDDNLRPALLLDDFKDALKNNPYTQIIAKLGFIRQAEPALAYGDYRQLVLTNRQYAYVRDWNGEQVIIALNNDDNEAWLDLPASGCDTFMGAISGESIASENGKIHVCIPANCGEIFVPVTHKEKIEVAGKGILMTAIEKYEAKAEATEEPEIKAVAVKAEVVEKQTEEEKTASGEVKSVKTEKKAEVKRPEHAPANKSYEEMTIPELQAAILDKMRKNGPVTPEMQRSVDENVYHDSLVNWVKSFR